MSAAFMMVTTTVGDRSDAKALACALVEARLAGCVQIMPIDSTYRWKDAIETTSEHLLLCKIRASDYPAVEMTIRTKHSYEVPEIVAVPIVAGAARYLEWLLEATARQPL